MPASAQEDPDFDPFDTSVAEKVIPVRKPKVSQRSTISIEDDDFDPESTFKAKKTARLPPRPELPDPFAVVDSQQAIDPAVKILTPVTEVREAELGASANNNNDKNQLKDLEKELLEEIGGPLKRSFTDDDFDPRATSSPEPEPEEDDPFDTSNIGI